MAVKYITIKSYINNILQNIGVITFQVAMPYIVRAVHA